MPTLTLHVDNLKPGDPANNIRKHLGQLPFVGIVIVDPDRGTVNVTHDGTGTRDEVAAALGDLGYPELGLFCTEQRARVLMRSAMARFHGEE